MTARKTPPAEDTQSYTFQEVSTEPAGKVCGCEGVDVAPLTALVEELLSRAARIEEIVTVACATVDVLANRTDIQTVRLDTLCDAVRQVGEHQQYLTEVTGQVDERTAQMSDMVVGFVNQVGPMFASMGQGGPKDMLKMIGSMMKGALNG